ncbi:hypothetical protein FRC00_003775 [Tulasnella sp. 408]|nr:hypothetical protein FRC00_003775 [Tulasnella sp. 408]
MTSTYHLLTSLPGQRARATDGKLISPIWKRLQDGKFWFNYAWELARRLQVQASPEDPAGNAHARPDVQQADDRIFWNKHLHPMLIQCGASNGEREISRFILPVIHGCKRPFLFTLLLDSIAQPNSSCSLRTPNSRHPVQFALISRQARHRAGRQYFTRGGVDAKGNPGNFNQSEQTFISAPPSSPTTCPRSHPTSRLEGARLFTGPKSSTPSAFRAHIDNQADTYGKLLLLDLVKGRGREKLVKDAYEDLVWSERDKENKEEKVPDSMDVEGDNRGIMDAVNYVHFDLHSERSGDKRYRVDEKTELDWTLKNYGTNRMQTSFAKRAMDKQANDFGLLTHPEFSIEQEEEFMKTFREVWSDHGNFIATAYTGTGALRTDFTRTGVRTKKGMVFDKLTSGWRYILNNHSDGYKQDAFDLMIGAWQPHGDPGEAVVLLHDKRHWTVRLVPYIFWFSLVMIFFTLALRRASSYSVLYPLSLYASLFTISAAYMARNSIDFIAWPRLNYQPMLDAIYYEGPGARTKKGSKARGEGVVQEVHKGEKTILEEAIKVR